ncbi:MAG: hypothetical protein EBS85_06280 [Micrococcales bacterium]|nr:hypothetical protein [Actinomycetota bacterium]NCA08312.1 hypothetical protein [Micrococcales bacterium]
MTNIKTLLVKVPAITLFFWIIKVLSTTVGETLADYLNSTLGLGDNGTIIVMTAVLAILLAAQLLLTKYVPSVYWATIVAVSTVGTLITDNMHTNFGWQNWQLTILFGVVLIAVFAIWWAQEKTLSIKTINTRKREGYYWVAVLATFAMGTAAGDIFLDDLGFPLLESTFIFLAVIAVIAGLWRIKVLGQVFGFWTIYILTRPLGASFGDYLSLSKDEAPDALDLGAQNVTLVFLGLIVALVVYLSITKRDVITAE